MSKETWQKVNHRRKLEEKGLNATTRQQTKLVKDQFSTTDKEVKKNCICPQFNKSVKKKNELLFFVNFDPPPLPYKGTIQKKKDRYALLQYIQRIKFQVMQCTSYITFGIFIWKGKPLKYSFNGTIKQ